MAKISLWLDTRKESKSGLYPVVLRITNKGTSAHVNTHISISPDCWSGSAIVGRENKRLNDRVQWMLLDARLRLSDECAKTRLSLRQVRRQ